MSLASTAASGSTVDEAMKRTFTTASVVSLPTRRTTPSWITRSSFAWIGFGISISSSRNSVPPLAASSRPGLSRTAPVNAPLRWPNISDSSRPSGRAAQFTAMNGRLERRLWWWMNCAIISLPLPLSPVMNTDASVGATLRASSIALLARFARDQQRVHRSPDQHLQVRGGKRLGEVVECSLTQRFDARLDAGVTRHHDDHRVVIGPQGGAQQGESIDLRHVQVYEHEVECAALQQVEGFLPAAANGHVVAFVAQHRRAALAQRVFVIDHENP